MERNHHLRSLATLDLIVVSPSPGADATAAAIEIAE